VAVESLTLVDSKQPREEIRAYCLSLESPIEMGEWRISLAGRPKTVVAAAQRESKTLCHWYWGPSNDPTDRVFGEAGRGKDVSVPFLAEGKIQGYKGESKVVIENYNGELPYDMLVRLMHNTPLRIGAEIPWVCKELWITSRFPPDKFIPVEDTGLMLINRLDQVVHFDAHGNVFPRTKCSYPPCALSAHLHSVFCSDLKCVEARKHLCSGCTTYIEYGRHKCDVCARCSTPGCTHAAVKKGEHCVQCLRKHKLNLNKMEH